MFETDPPPSPAAWEHTPCRFCHGKSLCGGWWSCQVSSVDGRGPPISPPSFGANGGEGARLSDVGCQPRRFQCQVSRTPAGAGAASHHCNGGTPNVRGCLRRPPFVKVRRLQQRWALPPRRPPLLPQPQEQPRRLVRPRCPQQEEEERRVGDVVGTLAFGIGLPCRFRSSCSAATRIQASCRAAGPSVWTSGKTPRWASCFSPAG